MKIIPIICQPRHPIYRLTQYPTRHHRSEGRAREIESMLDVSPAGKNHRRGAPLREHYPEYWVRNSDRKGTLHAKGRFLLQNEF